MSDESCDLCGDVTSTMFLSSRCHPTAPLRVEKHGSAIVIRCYVPDCSREVARLQLADADEVDWRHRWHERLGRGHVESEGKFYDRLALIRDALVMVRDADDDCKRDGLPTIPDAARSKIDAALRENEARNIQFHPDAFSMAMDPLKDEKP